MQISGVSGEKIAIIHELTIVSKMSTFFNEMDSCIANKNVYILYIFNALFTFARLLDFAFLRNSQRHPEMCRQQSVRETNRW